MKVIAKLEDCEVTVDDGNSKDPTSSRWSDQHERVKEIIKEAKEAVIEIHKQKVSDQ